MHATAQQRAAHVSRAGRRVIAALAGFISIREKIDYITNKCYIAVVWHSNSEEAITMSQLFHKSTDSFIRITSVALCLLFSYLVAQAQNQDFSPGEKEEIKAVSSCADCTDTINAEAIKKVFEKAGEMARDVLVDHYYEKGLEIISGSAMVAAGASIVVGLIKPSELAPPSIDEHHEQTTPQYAPQAYPVIVPNNKPPRK
jgi:hypothetical protein